MIWSGELAPVARQLRTVYEMGVLGTAAAVRTAMQAAHVGKTYGELKRKRLIEE